MSNEQLYLIIGVPILFNFTTALTFYVLLNGNLNKRLDDLSANFNARLDDLKDLWRAELRRVEEVLDARLKHLEERNASR